MRTFQAAMHPIKGYSAQLSLTYGHRHRRTRDPVRSPLVKPVIGGLVVGSVTTSEYPLLYVFLLAVFLFTFEWRLHFYFLFEIDLFIFEVSFFHSLIPLLTHISLTSHALVVLWLLWETNENGSFYQPSNKNKTSHKPSKFLWSGH